MTALSGQLSHSQPDKTRTSRNRPARCPRRPEACRPEPHAAPSDLAHATLGTRVHKSRETGTGSFGTRHCQAQFVPANGRFSGASRRTRGRIGRGPARAGEEGPETRPPRRTNGGPGSRLSNQGNVDEVREASIRSVVCQAGFNPSPRRWDPCLLSAGSGLPSAGPCLLAADRAPAP